MFVREDKVLKAISNSKGPTTKQEMLTLYLKGMLMGIADLIPGVSGGTIAFITGIYNDLLGAISQVNASFVKELFSKNYKSALEKSSARFLIILVSGIATSIFLFARLMHYLMENHAIPTWALFFGLILASIFSLGRNIKNILGVNLLWIFYWSRLCLRSCIFGPRIHT